MARPDVVEKIASGKKLDPDETQYAMDRGLLPFESEELLEDDEESGERSLDDLTVAELKELLDDRGIEFPSDAKKADLVELASNSES